MRYKVTRCVCDSGHASSWVLRAGVRPTLQHVTCLSGDSTPLLQPRTHLPIVEMSVLDLVGHLQSVGWKLSVWRPAAGSRRSVPPPVQVATGRPKVFYIRSDSAVVHIDYLRCCAMLEQLTQTELEHFQAKPYYQNLLGRGKHGHY